MHGRAFYSVCTEERAELIMKRFVVLSFSILLLASCNTFSTIKGSYQIEEEIDGNFVQMSIFKDEGEFIEYINNREVNKGTYQEEGKGKYLMVGDNQEFTIDLNNDNSFYRTINGINDGEAIKMINIDDTPIKFSTEFDDEDEYRKLLDD